MSPLLMLVVWIVGSLLVAFAARHRTLGFWGFLIVSIFVSPLVVAAALLLTAPRDARSRAESRP